jgi:hypothetical protein
VVATLSRSEPSPATEGVGAAAPVEDGDRLLFDRIRLGLRLILAGVVAVFVGELLISQGGLPFINLVQGMNFVLVAVALRFLNDPVRRGFNLAEDAMTPVVLFVGLSLVTATLVSRCVSIVLPEQREVLLLAPVRAGSAQDAVRPPGIESVVRKR